LGGGWDVAEVKVANGAKPDMGVLTSDLAALAAPDNGEVRDRLAAAEQGCCQAQTLVQQLQVLAKGGTPAKKPQDLVKIINEAARLAVTCSKSWVEFSLPEQLWQVEANLGQMYQAMASCIKRAAQEISWAPM
jgi:hypothetical protein